MEVIEYLDNTGQVLVKRMPDNGQLEIKWGSQLTVRESQDAVFFRDGKALDIFSAGETDITSYTNGYTIDPRLGRNHFKALKDYFLSDYGFRLSHSRLYSELNREPIKLTDSRKNTNK